MTFGRRLATVIVVEYGRRGGPPLPLRQEGGSYSPSKQDSSSKLAYWHYRTAPQSCPSCQSYCVGHKVRGHISWDNTCLVLLWLIFWSTLISILSSILSLLSSLLICCVSFPYVAAHLSTFCITRVVAGQQLLLQQCT